MCADCLTQIFMRKLGIPVDADSYAEYLSTKLALNVRENADLLLTGVHEEVLFNVDKFTRDLLPWTSSFIVGIFSSDLMLLGKWEARLQDVKQAYLIMVKAILHDNKSFYVAHIRERANVFR